ncbi:helix-turn-helix domain-containing protein [Myroides fluvii]|uniref:helix-turn-helix domain-containing protein n=1 Tax=Myroides fluvii TaxID=2572594 RepID=UPI00131BA58B|nr:AraC family transcriptional regulator [Myroides fluvii]
MKGISVFQPHKQPDVLIEEGYFSILFIKAGHLQFHQGNEALLVTKGHIVINTPARAEKPSYVSDDCQVIGVKYTLDYLKEITTLNNFYKTFAHFEYQYLPIWDLSPTEQQTIAELIRKLKRREEAFGHHLFADHLFNLTFTELVLELIDIGSKQDKTSFQNYNRAEYLALQFMILARDAYKNETKLDFYADQLAVSVKYLSETLKSITGKTAKEILVELRMNQAKSLLATSDLDITEIAYALSYDSLSSFSRSFKLIEGMSPKEYRDSHL